MEPEDTEQNKPDEKTIHYANEIARMVDEVKAKEEAEMQALEDNSEPEKKSRLPLIIGIVTVVAVAGIVAGILIMNSQNKPVEDVPEEIVEEEPVENSATPVGFDGSDRLKVLINDRHNAYVLTYNSNGEVIKQVLIARNAYHAKRLANGKVLVDGQSRTYDDIPFNNLKIVSSVYNWVVFDLNIEPTIVAEVSAPESAGVELYFRLYSNGEVWTSIDESLKKDYYGPEDTIPQPIATGVDTLKIRDDGVTIYVYGEYATDISCSNYDYVMFENFSIIEATY